jgi:hypothetical protein
MAKKKVIKVIETPIKDEYKPPLSVFFQKFYEIVNKFNTKEKL